MEAAWSITDLPPAAPGILLLLLLVELGLLGSSSFAIFNNLNTFDYEIASNRSESNFCVDFHDLDSFCDVDNADNALQW